MAAISGAALLGVVAAALFGTEITRAFLIGGAFMLVDIGLSIILELMFA